MAEIRYGMAEATRDTITVVLVNNFKGGVYDKEGNFLGDGEIVEDRAILTNDETLKKHTKEEVVQWAQVVDDSTTVDLGSHEALIRLAGCAYGEASTKDVYEEMAGIASVIKRQADERKQQIDELLKDGGTYAFAASGKNVRFNTFVKATPVYRNNSEGMKKAIKAGINAIIGGKDFSNGAYFWDGLDIKTNYKNHPKIKSGFLVTDKAHNIYSIESSSVDVTTYWLDAKGKPVKERGKYTHTYESTAAAGGTIFSKYTDDYIKATGSKKYK